MAKLPAYMVWNKCLTCKKKVIGASNRSQQGAQNDYEKQVDKHKEKCDWKPAPEGLRD